MIIDSITVKNFRSYGEAELHPMHTGITAITGSNGAGKSSICTHAIVWCLFGQTPDGVSVRDLRRQGTPEGEPTEVTVTMHAEGREIIVYRAMKGRGLTTVASATVDGVEHADIKSNAVTNFVEATLGMDATAFLTAFMVRQKELDALVRQTAAARKKTIEKLAGITRLQSAVEEARSQARTLKIALDALPSISAEELEQMEQRALELETLIADEKSELAAAQEADELASAAAKEAALELRAAEKASREAYAAREKTASLLARIENNENLATKGLLAVQKAAETVAKAEQEHAEALEAWTLDTPPTIQDTTEISAQLNALRGERKSILASQEALENNKNTCPTCAQPTDTSAIAADLATRLQVITTEGKTLNTQLEQANHHNTIATHIATTKTQLDNAKSEHARVENKLTEITNEITNDKNTLENNGGTIATVNTEHLTTLTETLETLEQKATQTRNHHTTLTQQNHAHATEHAALTTNLANARANATLKKTTLNEHEIASALAITLEKYRAQRLATLAPALAESASDYLTTLTAGAFIGLELSDDFEPSIIDNQRHSRPVTMLSGGEESLVALSLRLAIGDEVVDGNGSLLVLDEILGAMDEDRRRLIMGALRGLNRQIIMVNHLPEQGADLTVEVTPHRNGSTIAPGA